MSAALPGNCFHLRTSSSFLSPAYSTAAPRIAFGFGTQSVRLPLPVRYPSIACRSVDGGGGSSLPPGGGRGGGGGGAGAGDEDGGGEDGDDEEDEDGPLLDFDEIMKQAAARGVNLPEDMIETAKTRGIRGRVLHSYFDLIASPLGFLIGACSLLRDRMLADEAFLFKVVTEVLIDSCCATFAEIQKRGKDFWAEFELYAADILVGVVVDVALVGMLAPCVRFGKLNSSTSLTGRMASMFGALPSSVFEADRMGCKYSVQQRIGTYFLKGLSYGAVGFTCGLIGQGIANSIMTAKRKSKESEELVRVPPLVKSAALWGAFLAVSSNTRYQVINGLERVIETAPITKRIPEVAKAFTIGVRFANNINGGMQFVDWARWSGCQ